MAMITIQSTQKPSHQQSNFAVVISSLMPANFNRLTEIEAQEQQWDNAIVDAIF